MIKPGFIIALVCMLALILAGFLLIKDDRPPVGAGVAHGKLIPDLKEDSVSAIDIKKGGVSVKLEKKGADWILTSDKNRPAKTDRIKSLLSALSNATKSNSRTGGEKNFDLDGDHVTELVLHREAGDKTVSLGKSINYGQSAFVREGKDIYEIDKGIDTDAGVRTEGTEGEDKRDKRILDPAYFYDLKIFGFSSNDIIDIAIKKGHDTTRIQRVIPGKGPLQPKQEPGKDDKPVWWITEPEGLEANDATLNSICSNLSALTAKAYADKIPEKDRGLDKPAVKVKLRLKDGTEHNLAFGKLEGDDAVMSVSGKADAYLVYKYVFDNVNSKYEDLKKKDEEKKDAKPDENKTGAAPVPPFNAPQIIQTQAPKKELPRAEVPQPPTKIEPPPNLVPPPAVVKPPEEKK